MRDPDGHLYHRSNEVEEAITVLSKLPATELVERCSIDNPKDPKYVPTECVLYFVRRPSFGSDQYAHRGLFVILRQRVLRAVPVATRRVAGSQQLGESSLDLEIRDAVLQKFQQMLCRDRGDYDERLDFYECRFNAALALLRKTTRRDVLRKRPGQVSATYEGDTNEPTAEVEKALGAVRNPENGEGLDVLYRSKLLAAISSLPPDEQRVIELILEDLPIDSQDEGVLTIVKVLGCVEKTVRNRRDRAFARLRDALKEEEDL